MKITNILSFLIQFNIIILTISFHFSHAKILYTWSQVIPGNKLSIRAILDGNVCPIAYVDNDKIEMLSHSSNNTETVCELIVEANTQNISLNDIKVPVLAKKVSKIAFIGDTGCRIKQLKQQACNSMDSWPLKNNLNSIAFHKPDLIIHVGDYLYRETKCKSTKNCGDIYGYSKETWYADWFEPAKDILQQFPFLFIRGNHENCNRAYEGWFRYLDSNPLFSKKCEDHISSWSLDVGPMKFFIFDSSSNIEIFTTKNRAAILKKEFDKLIQDKPIWLLTHIPFWNIPKQDFLQFKSYGNLTQIEAFGDKFPGNITTIVSGHIHIAQILLMNNFPDQIIVGNGGTLLYSQNQESVYRNIKFDYPNSKNYLAHEVNNFFGFGFAILSLEDHKFTFYNQNNKEMYSANLTQDFKLQTN